MGSCMQCWMVMSANVNIIACKWTLFSISIKRTHSELDTYQVEFIKWADFLIAIVHLTCACLCMSNFCMLAIKEILHFFAWFSSLLCLAIYTMYKRVCVFFFFDTLGFVFFAFHLCDVAVLINMISTEP